MNIRNQDSFEEQLSAYLDGELGDADHRRVERSLETDVDARVALERMRQTSDALKALPRLTAPPSMVDDVLSRMERDQLLDEPRIRVHRRPVSLRRLYPLLAAAAMIGIAVTVGLWGVPQAHRTNDGVVAIGPAPANAPTTDEKTSAFDHRARSERVTETESQSPLEQGLKNETASSSNTHSALDRASSSRAQTRPNSSVLHDANGPVAGPLHPSGRAQQDPDFRRLDDPSYEYRTTDETADAAGAFVLTIACNTELFSRYAGRLAFTDAAAGTAVVGGAAATPADADEPHPGVPRWESPRWHSTDSQRIVERVVTLPRTQLADLMAALVVDGAGAESIVLSAGGMVLASGPEDATRLASIVAGVDREGMAGDALRRNGSATDARTYADARRDGPLERLLQELGVPAADHAQSSASTAGASASAATVSEGAGTGGSPHEDRNARDRTAGIPSLAQREDRGQPPATTGAKQRPSDVPAAPSSSEFPVASAGKDTGVFTEFLQLDDDAAGMVNARPVGHDESWIVLRVRLIGPPLAPPPGEPGRLSPR